MQLLVVRRGSVEVGVRVSKRSLDIHGQLENDIRTVRLFVKYVHNREVDSVENTVQWHVNTGCLVQSDRSLAALFLLPLIEAAQS